MTDDKCGEHFARHPDRPHLVAVCTLSADHEGDHDNLLTGSKLRPPPDPDTLCDLCHQPPERHTATAYNDHEWRHQ